MGVDAPGASAGPSPWIDRFAPLVVRVAAAAGQGRVLDLACGGGRHARLLASLGCRVTAVDRDPQGPLALTAIPGIEGQVADLESGPWPFQDAQFAAIVVTNYLFRERLARVTDALAPGGVLLYETFAEGQERYGRPTNPAFLLRAGELLGLAGNAGLHVLAYEDGERPSAAGFVRVQSICALRPPLDGRLVLPAR